MVGEVINWGIIRINRFMD